MITGILIILAGIIGHYYCKSKINKATVPNVVLDWAEKLIPLVFITLGLFVFVYCLLP
jgi:cadmium resistance protein CadD (predicted permease)